MSEKTYREAMRMAAREYLEGVLGASSNVKQAAQRAGMSRTHFYRLCAAAGVRCRGKRPAVRTDTQRLLDQWRL